MKSDLHHLFPTKTRINAERGNLKFGPINGRKMPISCEASTKGEGVDGSPALNRPMPTRATSPERFFTLPFAMAEASIPMRKPHFASGITLIPSTKPR
ncbi:MAG: endonuclease [Bdellovibrionales bacterium]|nr:endonuclease [Bdellovibrionales bacterium]